MKNLTVHTFEHHKYWQVKLLVAVILSIAFSVEKYFFDLPIGDSQTWTVLVWILHIATVLIAIKVAFFSINTKEVKSYYYSSYLLNLAINNLHTEEKEVQDRMLRPIVMKWVEEPNEHGTALSNITSPWALQLIANFCLQEMGILEKKLGDELNSGNARKAEPHAAFKKILSPSELIKRLEEIQVYCNEKAP